MARVSSSARRRSLSSNVVICGIGCSSCWSFLLTITVLTSAGSVWHALMIGSPVVLRGHESLKIRQRSKVRCQCRALPPGPRGSWLACSCLAWYEIKLPSELGIGWQRCSPFLARCPYGNDRCYLVIHAVAGLPLAGLRVACARHLAAS